jgi:hypothetical protein
VKHGVNAKLQSLGMEALRRVLDGNEDDTQTLSMNKDILQSSLKDLGRTVHNEKVLLLFRLLAFVENRRPNEFSLICPSGPLAISKVRLGKAESETGDAAFRKLLVGSVLHELHQERPVWIHIVRKILTETSTLRAHGSSRGKGGLSLSPSLPLSPYYILIAPILICVVCSLFICFHNIYAIGRGNGRSSSIWCIHTFTHL